MKSAFSWIDWALVAAYFLVLVRISWKKGWKPASEVDFLLSGRKITLPAFVATLVSTWYGGILGVGIYIHIFRLETRYVFVSLIGCTALSFAWLALGVLHPTEADGYAYLGIEPYYPGLALALLVWAVGRPAKREAPSERVARLSDGRSARDDDPRG